MNVLLLTGRFGMGHYSAAMTLAQEVKRHDPTAHVEVQDIFEAVTPNHYQAFYGAYTWLVNKASIFYNTYYKMTERSRKNVKPPMMYALFGVLVRLLERVKPDVILSTLPLCSQLVSQYKKRFYAPFELVTCITDISAHNEWINDNTDYYLVGSDSVRRQLLARGVRAGSIFVSGIPVKAQFKEAHPAYAASYKHLLIMGGGLGLIPRDKQFYERLNALPDVRTTLIVGSNQAAYDELHGKYEHIEVVGYTDRVWEYMQQADLLLTKPGGITMFETIYSELPMLIRCPFLEQEVKNARFIEQHQIGRVLWDKNADVVQEIDRFLEDHEALASIRHKMAAFQSGLNDNALAAILNRVEHAAVLHVLPGAPVHKGVVA